MTPINATQIFDAVITAGSYQLALAFVDVLLIFTKD